MNTYSNPSTKGQPRPVSEPGCARLVWGVVLLALAALVASFAAVPYETESADMLPSYLKLVVYLLGLGALLAILGIWLIARYCSLQRAYQRYMPPWNADSGTFGRFAAELNAWYAGSGIPSGCDGDLAYFLKLQRSRLERRGLKMTHQTAPIKEGSYGVGCVSRKTQWYTSEMKYSPISRHIAFERGKNTVYDRMVEENMYETILHTPEEKELEHMELTCPNCGAVSPVASLVNGCSHCGTQFRINDLFPRVTNLVFLKNNSVITYRGIMRKSILAAMLLTCIGSVFHFMQDGHMLMTALLLSYGVALVGGGIGGYILGSIGLFLSIFNVDGRKHIPLFAFLRSKSRLKTTLKQYDPCFSYEKFEGQIISLLRMTIFAEDRSNLAFCRADTIDPRFDNILEMTYINALVIRQMQIKGDLLLLTLRTWWINYREVNNKIVKSGECIDMTLCRNISAPEPPGFSISSVNCPSCNGSFDAVRQRNCPYCGTEYHMENKGWIIEALQLV